MSYIDEIIPGLLQVNQVSNSSRVDIKQPDVFHEQERKTLRYEVPVCPDWYKKTYIPETQPQDTPRHPKYDTLAQIPNQVENVPPYDEWAAQRLEFIRIGTRMGFSLRRMWWVWSRREEARLRLEFGFVTLRAMQKLRDKFVQDVKSWVEKKNPDVFRCSRCGKYKTRDKFYRDKSRCNLISSRCKQCDTEYKRQRREEEKKKAKDNQKVIRVESDTVQNTKIEIPRTFPAEPYLKIGIGGIGLGVLSKQGNNKDIRKFRSEE